MTIWTSLKVGDPLYIKKMEVDDRLVAFEDSLMTHLQYTLFVNINLNYWEEFDELDAGSHRVIRDIVHVMFAPILLVYRGTHAEPILTRFKELTLWSLINSMDVPYPRDPVMHVHRVVQNILEMFSETTYARLRTEMVAIDHHAQVLQRAWRDAITNPAHSVCRRRLMREFTELETATV